MTTADIAVIKAEIASMRQTIRWLVGAVGILAALHGPEMVKLIAGP